jgi:hypothetical protein
MTASGPNASRRSPVRTLMAAILTLAWLLCAVVEPASAQSRTVRVGVYENEPKVYTGEDGRPTGIFVDLLTAIAEEEGWDLEFVDGTWSEGLEALSAGRIDLMCDVAYTAERDALYDFHELPVVESWSYVYAAPGRRVDLITELDGMSVAVLAGSVQESVFKQMVAGFELDVTLVPADSLKEAFSMAAGGTADAAVSNYLFGDRYYRVYGLEKTPVVFNPVPLHFAVAEGRNAELLDAIDRSLAGWVVQEGSVYYRTLERYMVVDAPAGVPPYVLSALLAAAVLLAAALAWILTLRWQVNVRTDGLLRAQAELKEHRAHLEDLVRERTSRIEEVNAELEAASSAKSDFLARMSHELRTPLNSVIGFSELLLMGASGELAPEQRRQTELINHAGKHLLRLINDVLDLAKVEQGTMETECAAFDAAAVVGVVVETLAVQADERGLTLSAELPAEGVPVDSDERLVRQILMNLVGNAIKFTEEGAVKVTAVRDADSSVTLQVHDTGPGIPDDDQERLFTAFWQGEGVRAPGHSGTGLGLSISRRMAELIGGKLTVESVVGEGSTFSLQIPPADRP